jgi:hypothetical protein
MARVTVRTAKYFVVGIVAALALSGALSPSAFAWRHKQHPPKQPKIHYKPDKNAYLFGGKYKAPKNQRVPKVSHRNSHRDKKTGQTVYGKQ